MNPIEPQLFPSGEKIEKAGRAELHRLETEVGTTLCNLKKSRETLVAKVRAERKGQILSELQAKRKQVEKDLRQKMDQRNSAFANVVKAEKKAKDAFLKLETGFYAELETFLQTSPLSEKPQTSVSSIDLLHAQIQTMNGILEAKKQFKHYGPFLKIPEIEESVVKRAKMLQRRHQRIMDFHLNARESVQVEKMREALKIQDALLLDLLHKKDELKSQELETQRELEEIKAEISGLDQLLKRGEEVRVKICQTLQQSKESKRNPPRGRINTLTPQTEVSFEKALASLVITYVVGEGGNEEITIRNIEALTTAGAKIIFRGCDLRRELPFCDYVVFHPGGSSHAGLDHYKKAAQAAGTHFICLPCKMGSSRIVEYVAKKIASKKEEDIS